MAIVLAAAAVAVAVALVVAVAVAAAAAVVTTVAAASTAAAVIAAANPTGAACTALAEITATSPPALIVSAALGETLPQPLHGAAHPLLRGIVAQPQRLAHRTQVLLLVIPQDNRVVVGFAEFGHGLVQVGTQLFPVGQRFGSGIKLGHSLPFAGLPAEFIPAEIEGEIAGAPAQPARQRGVFGQLPGQGPRTARQRDERLLRHLGRQVRRLHLPQGRGIHQVRVPGRQLREGAFLPLFGVLAQKPGVGLRLHLTQ